VRVRVRVRGRAVRGVNAVRVAESTGGAEVLE